MKHFMRWKFVLPVIFVLVGSVILTQVNWVRDVPAPKRGQALVKTDQPVDMTDGSVLVPEESTPNSVEPALISRGHTVENDEFTLKPDEPETIAQAQAVNKNFGGILDLLFRYDIFLDRCLPPPVALDADGRPLSSWRFALAGFRGLFIKEGGPPPEFQFPWNSPENESFAKLPAKYYGYSTDAFSAFDLTGTKETSVLAISGPGTAFDEDLRCSFSDLADDTILIVESRNSGVHWMEPGDIDIRTVPHRIGGPGKRTISGTTPLGLYVGFADGAVWLLKNDVPFETLEKLFTVSGAKKNKRENLLWEYRLRLDIESQKSSFEHYRRTVKPAGPHLQLPHDLRKARGRE